MATLLAVKGLYISVEQDKPMRGMQDDDLVNHDLILAFRNELGMTHDDFYMVLTDFEIKVKVSASFASFGDQHFSYW